MQKIRIKKRAELEESQSPASQADERKTKIDDVRDWVSTTIRRRSSKTRISLDKLFGGSKRVSLPVNSTT